MDWLARHTPPHSAHGDVKPVAIGVGKLIWPDAKAVGIKRHGFNDALSRALPRALISRRSPRTAPCASASTAISGGGVDRAPGLALDRIAKIERRLDGEDARR